MNLRIMSFNSRYKNKRDRINRWKNRKSLIAQVIAKYSPNIIGFQEVLYEQLRDLRDGLVDYKYYGVGRDNGRRKGEHNPLFYSKDKVKFGTFKTFWLSKTPHIPSGFKGDMKRIVTWGKIISPKPALIVNTHFAHRSEKARLASVDVIQKFLEKEGADLPVILMGDFNFYPGSEEFQKMKQVLHNGFELHNPELLNTKVTFHGWSGQTENLTPSVPSPNFIDYFWVNDKIKIKEIRILNDCPGDTPGIFPSDHWPILIDIEI